MVDWVMPKRKECSIYQTVQEKNGHQHDSNRTKESASGTEEAAILYVLLQSEGANNRKFVIFQLANNNSLWCTGY